MKDLKKEIMIWLSIAVGSLLYGVGTVLFIFPHSLLLGGTSGISVMLNTYLKAVPPGTILMIINTALLLLAFCVLGNSMALKTLVGSMLTAFSIGGLERVFVFEAPLISNAFLSALTGAAIIAIASGIMFYVDSSSGGTDIIALIVKKYFPIDIGKALLMTDFLIVIAGGIVSGITIAIVSFAGLLVKTLGIDFVISLIKKQTHGTK